MITVPLNATPSQTLAIVLGGQPCQINVYQKLPAVFVDLYVAGVLVIGGVQAQNLNRIVRDVYLGFVGDFVFNDTQGTDDPDWTGLGTRFVLLYVEEADESQIPSRT